MSCVKCAGARERIFCRHLASLELCEKTRCECGCRAVVQRSSRKGRAPGQAEQWPLPVITAVRYHLMFLCATYAAASCAGVKIFLRAGACGGSGIKETAAPTRYKGRGCDAVKVVDAVQPGAAPVIYFYLNVEIGKKIGHQESQKRASAPDSWRGRVCRSAAIS